MRRHDEPNRVYMHVGSVIEALASIGATDRELKRLFKKGGGISLIDIAKIECAHWHDVEEDAL